MLTEVYSVEVVGGFLSSDRLFFILLLAHALKNLLPISKLIAFLPTKMREEPKLSITEGTIVSRRACSRGPYKKTTISHRSQAAWLNI